MSVRLRFFLVAAVAALLVAGCGGGMPASSDAIATVNGEAVTIEAFETLVTSRVAAEGGESGHPDPSRYGQVEQLQRQTLGELIQDRVVAAAAEQIGITVTERQVEERFEELAQQYGGVEQLREEIRNRGRTEEDVREQLAAVVRSELLAAHFSEETGVSDAELREEYEGRVEAGDMRVADVSHILVPTRAEAEEILDLLEQGEDFATLAEERSTDDFSAVNGGDLGESRQGRFVEPFDNAVWAAQAGDIVGPVQTEFGFHVIHVREFRTIPFEEVADQLREELGGRQAQGSFDEWYRDALMTADVWVQPRVGKWDPSSGRVTPGTSLSESTPTPAATPGGGQTPAPGSPGGAPGSPSPSPAG